MVAYSRDEIISVSDMARGFSNILGSIIDKTKDKVAISKNNKLQAVLLDIEEYERLKSISEMIEYVDIESKIKQREKSSTITLEESMKRHGISIDEL